MPDSYPDTGTIYNFNPTTYTASVQPDGSLTTFLKNVTVSRAIAPNLLGNGTRVALLFMDDNNPGDCWVVGVLAAGSPIAPNCAAALIHNSAAISIPNATQTTLSFNTKDFDTLSTAGLTPFYGSDHTKLAINSPGIYEGWAGIEWASNNAGLRVISIFDTTLNQFITLQELPPVNGDTTDMTMSTGPRLVPAATAWQVQVFQSSGGALNINFGAAYTPYFGVKQLG